ncbi:MAG: hypothetical protein J1E40_08860, partial [Oscillospiraceae bacterium]|nr:hypothetical protein [Oscillospiraceae bacterium]
DISVNNSTREITYELNGITFTNSYPEGGIVDGYFHDSGGVKPEYIGFETRISYCLDGNNIMMMISPDLLTVYSGPDIIADVRFTGSGFNIENVRFDEPVPYDESLIKQYTYPDGTVEDYIITANSIIPAGDLAAETEYSEAFHGVEMISDTAERSVSVSESGNKSYAVYASDAGYPVKTFDVLISYPDGTMEEFSIAEDQLSEISDLSSAEYSVAISEAPDTTGHLATDSEYSSTGESTAEYPVYITVDEALSSAGEDLVLHRSGEYIMSKLYEPYGMYYDYQKNCYIYNGETVRFFYDSVEKASFTNYFTGTIDLEAVYENDVLVGITECSDEVYAIHDEKQAMFSSVLPDTSIVVLPDASMVMVN